MCSVYICLACRLPLPRRADAVSLPMSVVPMDACRLCPTVASALYEPAVMCFGTAPLTSRSAIKYTFVEILNKHFWFEVSICIDHALTCLCTGADFL